MNQCYGKKKKEYHHFGKRYLITNVLILIAMFVNNHNNKNKNKFHTEFEEF